ARHPTDPEGTMTAFRDLDTVRTRTREVVAMMMAADPTYAGDRVGTPICLCGKSMWMHELDKVKAPREGCDGFVLDEVEVWVCHAVRLSTTGN
ncbi:MAG: hypothetical protein ACRD0W_22790, partial [Acidimicrobiales bacterium]